MSCLLVCCMNGDEIHTTISCHFSFTGSIRVPELFDVCINHIQQIENQPGIRPGALTPATKLSNVRLSHGVDFSDEKTGASGALCTSPGRARLIPPWGCQGGGKPQNPSTGMAGMGANASSLHRDGRNGAKPQTPPQGRLLWAGSCSQVTDATRRHLLP